MDDNKELFACLDLMNELLGKLEISESYDGSLIAELDSLLSRLYALGVSGRTHMETIYEQEYAYVKRLGIMTEETDLIRMRYVNFNLSLNLEDAYEIYGDFIRSFKHGRKMYTSFLPNLFEMPYSLVGEARPRNKCNLSALTNVYIYSGLFRKDSLFLKKLVTLIYMYFTSDRDLSEITYNQYLLLRQRAMMLAAPQKILCREDYWKYYTTIQEIVKKDLEFLRARDKIEEDQ